MTSEQVQLVRQTFALIEPRSRVAALIFYQQLFALDPALRALFSADIEIQGRKLMEMLGAAVGLLDSPHTLQAVLRDLGRRHTTYGVEDKHYDTVGEALLSMLHECLGPAFTPPARAAWAALYAIVATTMQGTDRKLSIRD
ncbi:MAG: globin domain-containing protein [Verrucomicrobiota bacterium]